MNIMRAAALCMLVGMGSAAQFGYQLHSFNDMRQWDVVAAKGAVNPGIVRLKIDPHYVSNTEFCKRHGFSGKHCLVLSHDSPSMSETYNTSLELAAMLPTFKDGAIALCVKYTGLACLDFEFLKVVDEMFDAITPVAKANNVTLILDGSVTPTDRSCVHDRWMPWTSTWIPGRDPAAAATSDSGYYARYQVLNMNCCDNVVKNTAALSPPYGKFSSLPTPYQLWEPQDQTTIRKVRDAYKETNTTQELLFAINQDPVALLNYVTAAPEGPSTEALLSSNGVVFERTGGLWGGVSGFESATITRVEVCGRHVAAYDPASATLLVSGSGHIHRVELAAPLAGLQCSENGFIYITADGNVHHATSSQKLLAVERLAAVSGPVESAFYLPSVNVTVSSNGSWVFGQQGDISVVMGVGNSLRLASNATQSDSDIFFTVADAYCFNCEKYNKRPTPRMCDQIPVPQTNVMSYTLTTPNVLKEQIVSGTHGSGKWAPYILHSCNKDVLHGSFGIGQSPVPVAPSDGAQAVEAVYYKALSKVTSDNCPSECGCPSAYTGTDMQKFVFPSLNRA